MPIVGIKSKPIYRHKLHAHAWRLLWWLIWEMDDDCVVRGGWRVRAARAMKSDRIWIGRCAEELVDARLIHTRANLRWVKVLTGNITGGQT